MANNTVEIRITAQDQASGTFDKVKRSAGDMGSGLTKAGKEGSGGLGEIGKTAAGVLAANVIGGLTGQVGDFAGSIISTAATFDAKMSEIKSATGATGDELDKLRKLAIDMGAQTVFDANQAAEGITELGLAGMSTADIMGGGLKAALDLAAAGQISVGEAADTTSNALSMFGLKAKDAGHAADVLVGAASASSATMGDMEEGLAAAGSVAHTMGLSLDDTSTALALFANNGLKGGDAGTSFKTMLLALAKPTATATEEMKKLGIMTADGSSKFFDATGHIKSAAEMSGVLQEALKGLTPEQQANALATMFGTDAIRASSIMAGEGSDKFKDLEKTVTAQGQAADKAAALNDNFNGKMASLGGTIDGIKIQIGTALLPVLSSMADGFNNALQAASSGDWQGAADAIHTAIDNILPADWAAKVDEWSADFRKGLSAFTTWWAGWTTDLANGWDTVVRGWNVAASAFSTFWTNLSTGWNTATSAITTWWAGWTTSLAAGWDGVSRGWTNFSTTIGTWWTNLSTGWATVTGAISGALTTFWTDLSNGWSGVVAGWNAVGTTLGTWWSNLSTGWNTVTSAIGGALSTFWTNLSNGWNAVVSAWNTAGAIIGTFWSNLSTGWNTVMTFIGGLWTSFTGGLKTAWDTFTGWFSGIGDATDGFLQNMAAAFGIRTAEMEKDWAKFVGSTIDGAAQIVSAVNEAAASVAGAPSGGGGTSSPPPPQHKALGGLVYGAGTGTSDSVPAMLSSGEYVMPASAVQHWGAATFDAMRDGQAPSGGQGIIINIYGDVNDTDRFAAKVEAALNGRVMATSAGWRL